jgi:hypothetical protein
MAAETPPVRPTVVPDPQTQKEIENILDSPRILSEAIKDLKKQQADAEADLARWPKTWLQRR